MSVPCPFASYAEEHPDGPPPDEFFMGLAYNEAIRAWQRDEVPVGALVVRDGKVLARDSNRVRERCDPTAHGEILALRAAAMALGDWRLEGCTLYVTKEPCPLCAGACVLGRVDRVVFGLPDPAMGCLGGGGRDFSSIPSFNHHFSVRGGVLEIHNLRLFQKFFLGKRKK
jgi:tRNA(adenine34) deaminase